MVLERIDSRALRETVAAPTSAPRIRRPLRAPAHRAPATVPVTTAPRAVRSGRARQSRPRSVVTRWVFIAGIATAAVIIVLAVVQAGSLDLPSRWAVATIVVTAVAAAAGIVWREWRIVHTQLVRERTTSAQEQERRVLAEEKTRISRDLHDVVAHSMSLINVQATSAAYRHTDLPGDVVREFNEIAEAARGAITELRSVLDVLRDTGPVRESASQPGLGDLECLVHGAARSGVDVRLEFEPTVPFTALGVAGGLAAYRVVQEAISNAVRHAPGARILVSVASDGERIVLAVENGAATLRRASTMRAGGHGLIGMRERVAAAGGELETTRTADGFRVCARIPVHVVSSQ